MIIIHATMHVQPEKEQEFLVELKPLVTGSQAESGNVMYKLMKDTEQEHVYTMVEVWQDLDAVSAHNASDHFTDFVGKAKNFLSAPLDVKSYDGTELKHN